MLGFDLNKFWCFGFEMFQCFGDYWVLVSMGFGVWLLIKCKKRNKNINFFNFLGSQTCYLRKNMKNMFFQQDNEKKKELKQFELILV